MAANQLQYPVTRQEELHYYTKTRQDTWGSAVTVVASHTEGTERSPRRTASDRLLSQWNNFKIMSMHMLTECQLWCWKASQVLSGLCRNWWLIELFCWCLGATCMVAIATVLAAWNGKPLPDRFPLGLKLNAYVSVLAAIAKLALAVCLEEALATQKYLWYTTATPVRPLLDFERFELAARRPVGAIKLIWNMRVRSFATLGAIIFLLSLGLDPMFQQLVSYPSRPSLENPSSSPRLVKFETGNFQYDADGGYVIPSDVAFRSVLPKFFRGNTSNFPLNTFCPGTSCTWPTFETLALCSSCEDITSYLSHGCMVESGSWRKDFNPEPPRTNATTTRSCGWFFNASSPNPMLMTGHNLEGHGVLLARTLNFHDPIQNDLYWDGSMVSKDIPTPLLDFAVVSSPDFEAVYRNDTPQAVACTFRWCVKTLTANFTHGVYQEETVSVFTNNTRVPEPLSCAYHPDGTRDWKYDANITITPPDSEDSYFVRDDTMLSARFSVDYYVPNSIIQPDPKNVSNPIIVHYPLPIEEKGPVSETSYNDLWLKPGAAAQVAHDLAGNLTTMLRNDPRFAEEVHGSGIFVTYIEVEWWFFAFPLVVLILTLALLVATIIQTYKKDVWKTSDLTTLVHGLGEEAKVRLKSAQSMQEVRLLAKNLPVYLTDYNEGRRHLDVGPDAVDVTAK